MRAAVTEGPTEAAGAGALLIGAIVLCAAIGLGLGALVGAPALLGISGGTVGVGVGFWVVYRKFKHL